jgi:hypothetical protein
MTFDQFQKATNAVKPAKHRHKDSEDMIDFLEKEYWKQIRMSW